MEKGKSGGIRKQICDGNSNIMYVPYFHVCTAFRARADRYPNLTVKKIPKAVLARCEWGHDDYSLRVENLPKAPLAPGQMSMFDEEVEP